MDKLKVEMQLQISSYLSVAISILMKPCQVLAKDEDKNAHLETVLYNLVKVSA